MLGRDRTTYGGKMRKIYKITAKGKREISLNKADLLISEQSKCSVYFSKKEALANASAKAVVLFQRKRAFEYEVWES